MNNTFEDIESEIKLIEELLVKHEYYLKLTSNSKLKRKHKNKINDLIEQLHFYKVTVNVRTFEGLILEVLNKYVDFAKNGTSNKLA